MPALLLLLLPLAVAAQEPTPGRMLTGRVIDATTNGPVAGAAVTLEPREDRASARRVVTDVEGAYAFTSVRPGRYRLIVERTAYLGRSLDLELGSPGLTRVSVALEVEPIALAPLRVTARAEQPYHAAGDAHVDSGGAIRVAIERRRQREHLEPDVRVLTAADVAEAVTLGETDLFRALQRAPGVTTRDEFSAELWTRGAQWHHTQIRFDGFPLHNPLHGFGLLGGVHPEIVGDAVFHPGVRPASSAASGAAATLEITTRPASDATAGVAELSMASGRIAYRRPIGAGSGVSVALRRTWIDWLTRVVGGRDSDVFMPFYFWDAAARVDYDLGGSGRLEVSGLIERDGINDDVPDVLHGTRADRGNHVARLSWVVPFRSVEARVTLGGSWFDERVDSMMSDPPHNLSAPEEPPHRMDVRHVRASLELASSPDASIAWRGGLSLFDEAARYRGPAPFPVPNLDPGRMLAVDAQALRTSAWLDARFRIQPRIIADLGVRVLGGPRALDTSGLQAAPRASLRLEAAPGMFLTVAGGRSLQTTQSVAPLGPWVNQLAHWGVLWMLADDSVPLLRANTFTLGGEAWLGTEWLISANAWKRTSDGVATADPRAGVPLEQEPFVTTSGDARGLELMLRRIAGRITGSVSWTFGRSLLHAEGIEHPAPADRREAMDAILSIALSRGVRVGAAYTYMSGAPYRRVTIDPDRCNTFLEQCAPGTYRIEQAGARRGTSFRALDLMLDWSGETLGMRTALFVQVRNALGRRNDGAYRGTSLDCSVSCSQDTPQRLIDEFGPGLPAVPLIGFRVAF